MFKNQMNNFYKVIIVFSTLPILLIGKDIPTQKEMWEVIQNQQMEIKELNDKVEAAGDAIESSQPAASGGWWDKTQIGGYGELHMNLGQNDQIDFHRFVLFFGHDFDEKIRFFSELEVEHAFSGDSNPGAVELEQAFLEFDLNETHTAKAGLFLMPVGIMNETHEPNTFYGVERNSVEKAIIPSTWWEAGLGLTGKYDSGFSYDLAVHSGLDVSGRADYSIRGGRGKVAKADAQSHAYTGRIKYTGIPGVELAATGQYQTDIAQGTAITTGGTTFDEDVSAVLISFHADIQRGGFGLRALYARWDLDGAGPASIGADEQVGYYIEPSYRFETDKGDIGLFARYQWWDTRAGNATNTEIAQVDVGINYWPHENVVLKMDVAFEDLPAGGNEEEIINFGVGYQF